MKKAIDIFFIVLIFWVIYFLQSTFFMWFNILGIMPNLLIILIMTLGLFMRRKSGFIFGLIFGLCIDFSIGSRIGINAISLGLVGVAAEKLDKSFSKDNRITVMFLTGILTFLAELIIYFLQIVFCNVDIQILSFIKIVLIEIIYNEIIVAIIYPFILLFGSKLENDFTNNSFLKF